MLYVTHNDIFSVTFYPFRLSMGFHVGSTVMVQCLCLVDQHITKTYGRVEI
jgi:hypothetical protein